MILVQDYQLLTCFTASTALIDTEAKKAINMTAFLRKVGILV